MGIGEVFQQFCDNLKFTTGATISYRYQRITRQQALKYNEDLTFSLEEIDAFLPDVLKQAKQTKKGTGT
jgi:hypothetical protein